MLSQTELVAYRRGEELEEAAWSPAPAIAAGTTTVPESDAAVRDRGIGTSLFMPDGVGWRPLPSVETWA